MAPPEINRGYTPPRAEKLSLSLGVTSPEDLFEAFNVGVDGAGHTGGALRPRISPRTAGPIRVVSPASGRPWTPGSGTREIWRGC